MDATMLNTIIGVVGIIVGAIGIIVGIIGWKSLSTVTKVKNKANADNGATIQQASTMTINNGLSSREVSDLATETAEKVVKERTGFATPERLLTLKHVVDSVVIFTSDSSLYYHDFDCYISQKEKYMIKFTTECNKVHYPNVICSISDLSKTKLKLYVLPVFLEVLPQSIYKYLSFNSEELSEVVLTPNQTALGKTEDGRIIMVSIKKAQWKFCYNIRAAVYVPLEVIP